MMFYIDFVWYTSVLNFLDRAEVIYKAINQRYDYTISIIESSDEELKYRVYVTLYGFSEKSRLHKDKRE